MKHFTTLLLIVIQLFFCNNFAFSKEAPPQKTLLVPVESNAKINLQRKDFGFLKFLFFGIIQFLPIWVESFCYNSKTNT